MNATTRCYSESLEACRFEDWSECGFIGFDGLSSLLLYLIWIATALYLYFRKRNLLELDMNELHDIESQALGVIATYETHSASGKRTISITRLIQTASMWLEWPSFSILPLRAVKTTWLSQDDSSGLSFTSGEFQLDMIVVFLVLLIISFAIQSTRLNRIVVAPLLYDAIYFQLILAIAGVATCTGGVESVPLLQDQTCQCLDNYYVYVAIGCASYLILLWTTLNHKLNHQHEIENVQFRFKLSFTIILTLTKAGTPLLYAIQPALNRRMDANLALLVFGLPYMLLMGLLLVYNYTFQPCLGNGLQPNNIRTMTFASALYASFILVLESILYLIGYSGVTVAIQIMSAAFPLVWIASWMINRKRALLYAIPTLPLPELLGHKEERVRSVAAIAVSVGHLSRIPTSEIPEIATSLYAMTTLTEKTSAECVYACRAICRLYLVLGSPEPMFRRTTEPAIRFGKWKINTKKKEAAPSTLKEVVTRRSSVTYRSTKDLGRLQKHPVHPISNFEEEKASGLSLSEQQMKCVVESLLCLLSDDGWDVRVEAASVLAELYMSACCELTISEFVVVAALAADSSSRCSDDAIETLFELITSQLPVLDYICNPHALGSIASNLIHEKDVGLIKATLNILIECFQHASGKITTMHDWSCLRTVELDEFLRQGYQLARKRGQLVELFEKLVLLIAQVNRKFTIKKRISEKKNRIAYKLLRSSTIVAAKARWGGKKQQQTRRRSKLEFLRGKSAVFQDLVLQIQKGGGETN